MSKTKVTFLKYALLNYISIEFLKKYAQDIKLKLQNKKGDLENGIKLFSSNKKMV